MLEKVPGNDYGSANKGQDSIQGWFHSSSAARVAVGTQSWAHLDAKTGGGG